MHVHLLFLSCTVRIGTRVGLLSVHNIYVPCLHSTVTVLDDSCSIVNSRILRMEESSLLKDILRVVTSDVDASACGL